MTTDEYGGPDPPVPTWLAILFVMFAIFLVVAFVLAFCQQQGWIE